MLCEGFSLQWLLLLWSTGSRHAGFSSCGTRVSVVVAHWLKSAGSVVVAHGLSCSTACGIFPDQGSNPCPLHWQADSFFFFFLIIHLFYLFLAALGLRWCARALSSCGERGPLFVAVRMPIVVASLAAEHGLQAHGLQ